MNLAKVNLQQANFVKRTPKKRQKEAKKVRPADRQTDREATQIDRQRDI